MILLSELGRAWKNMHVHNSEVGVSPTRKSVRFVSCVLACAHAVLLPSGVRTKNGTHLFPFPLCCFELCPFPLCVLRDGWIEVKPKWNQCETEVERSLVDRSETELESM